MNKGIVIVGFAGIGKTTLVKKYKNVIDIESSPYKWNYSEVANSNLEKLKGMENRKRNSNFPKNYIEAIKKAKTKYDIVLVWIHPEEIVTYYDINDIDYYLCFPTKTAIKEYKKRFIERENNDNYIHHVLHHYNRRYKQLKDNPYKHIELIEGEPLETALLKMGINLTK